MFGYIIPDKPNMLIKDFALYKAYYCGLCKTIKKRNGNFLRLGVNYDIVLLSLVLHNLNNLEPQIIDSYCFINPIRKHKEVAFDSISESVVDVNTLMAYYKFQDDYIDGAKLKGFIGKAIYHRQYKKAKKALPATEASLKNNYEKLRELEKNNTEGIDIYADTFGKIMMNMGAEICSSKYSEEAASFMYQIGRWIYLIDAVDDIKSDFEKGNFNPFLNRYKDMTVEDIYGSKSQELSALLSDTEREIIKAYDKMKITVSEAPLSNIIYMGLGARRTQVLKGRGEKCQKIRL